MAGIGDCLWAAFIFMAVVLSTPLADRLFRSGRPPFDAGERVSLTPAGARALEDDQE